MKTAVFACLALGLLAMSAPISSSLEGREINAGSGCQNELESASKAAVDASDAAREASSSRDDFENCQRDPEDYDSRKDGCRGLRSDSESDAGTLESKMDDFDGHVREIQDSCGYAFTINKLSSMEASERKLADANQRLCASYRSLAPLVGAANVANTCKQAKDEQWCNSCLGR